MFFFKNLVHLVDEVFIGPLQKSLKHGVFSVYSIFLDWKWAEYVYTYKKCFCLATTYWTKLVGADNRGLKGFDPHPGCLKTKESPITREWNVQVDPLCVPNSSSAWGVSYCLMFFLCLGKWLGCVLLEATSHSWANEEMGADVKVSRYEWDESFPKHPKNTQALYTFTELLPLKSLQLPFRGRPTVPYCPSAGGVTRQPISHYSCWSNGRYPAEHPAEAFNRKRLQEDSNNLPKGRVITISQ